MGKIPVLLKQGTGLTSNYSTDGIYFVTDQTVAHGEQLELVMLLNHQSMGAVVRLCCCGNVVRVEKCDDQTGVAVAITKHLFALAPEMAETYLNAVMDEEHDSRNTRSS